MKIKLPQPDMSENISPNTLKYKSALIKLSGEALVGKSQDRGDRAILDGEILRGVASQIKKCVSHGAKIALVIGAGNIWRGSRQGGVDISRVKADHMGMLGTLINCIALGDVLERTGVESRVLSAVPVSQFCGEYSQEKAKRLMADGVVILIACGVGYPYFSTDTAAMLRGAELGVDVVLSAKAVSGVYDKDPAVHPDAVKYEKLDYDTIIKKNLRVIDQTAAALGRDNNTKALLFSLLEEDGIFKALSGEQIGTLIV